MGKNFRMEREENNNPKEFLAELLEYYIKGNFPPELIKNDRGVRYLSILSKDKSDFYVIMDVNSIPEIIKRKFVEKVMSDIHNKGRIIREYCCNDDAQILGLYCPKNN